MIIIAAEPGKKAYVTEIESGSGAIREFLGGDFTYADYYDKQIMIIRRKYTSKNRLPLNRSLTDINNRKINVIAGPFILCGRIGKAPVSLRPEQIKKYMSVFGDNETFCCENGRLYSCRENGK